MIDLSFLWPGSGNAYDIVKAATNIGWTSLGFNVYFKADGRGVNPLAVDNRSSGYTVDSLTQFTPPNLNRQISPVIFNLTDEKGLVLGSNFVRRITVLLMDDFKPNSLTKFIESNDYEIFSVIPTSKRSFQSACESLNCDLINLNFYCYYSPFKLKRGFINSAIQRGCFFEVSLSDKLLKNVDLKSFSDINLNEPVNTAFQRNLPSVLKYIPPKKLVLSSGSIELRDLPDPKLLIGMCNELLRGFSEKDLDLKCCLTKVPNDCINKGAARRTFGTGIVSFRDQDDLGKAFVQIHTFKP